MTINHVLAVVPVSDFDRSHDWYSRLFAVPPTNVPMPGTLAEWRLVQLGWLQMTRDVDRAGHGLVNFAVADAHEYAELLRQRGMEPTPIINATKGVQLTSVNDPDGNVITFIGRFRENY